MIIYYDNGSHPLLRECFRASGADFTPLKHGFTDHLKESNIRFMPQNRRNPVRLVYRKLKSFLPRSMIFTTPEPDQQDDKLIVFDSGATAEYLCWLCRRFPEKRVLLWYWNPVGEDHAFDLFPRRVEIWSYSHTDCERFGFRYNSQFYFDSLAEEAGKANPVPNSRPQVFFLGRDKGRKQSVLEIRSLLEQCGADTDFHLMQDGTQEHRREEQVLPYGSVIEKIRQSDVLLDITLQENAGLSLRPMEAMFFGKKLITNQKSIRACDFYRKENIYILDEDERSLREFLNTPYVPVDPEIRKYYLMSNWLKRFDQ